MKSTNAKNLLNAIEKTILEIDSIPSTNIKADSYFARFLVVYICGVFEEVIESIIKESVLKFNSTKLSIFFEKHISRTFRNPNISSINGILKSFDETWGDQLKNLPQKNLLAIDSIFNNKNYLAHGQDCNVTLKEVKQYYIDSKVVIKKIDKIFQSI